MTANNIIERQIKTLQMDLRKNIMGSVQEQLFTVVAAKFNDQMQSWERTFNLKFDSVQKDVSKIMIKLQECSKVRSQVLTLIDLTNNMPTNKVIDELRISALEIDHRLTDALKLKVDCDSFGRLDREVQKQEEVQTILQNRVKANLHKLEAYMEKSNAV